MKVGELEKELAKLDLKSQKGFNRYLELLDLECTTPNFYKALRNFEYENFENVPLQGYEMTPRMQEYLALKPKNYEEQQFKYDALLIEYRRSKLFGIGDYKENLVMKPLRVTKIKIDFKDNDTPHTYSMEKEFDVNTLDEEDIKTVKNIVTLISKLNDSSKEI